VGGGILSARCYPEKPAHCAINTAYRKILSGESFEPIVISAGEGRRDVDSEMQPYCGEKRALREVGEKILTELVGFVVLVIVGEPDTTSQLENLKPVFG
jgi:hypothetical protein